MFRRAAHGTRRRQAYLETNYSYDDFGNRLSIARPGQSTITYAIEPAFHTYIQKRSQPTGTGSTVLLTQFGYDARFGKQTLKVDANGNQFTTCYDSFGRRQSIQGPAPDGTGSSALTAACLTAGVTGASRPVARETRNADPLLAAAGQAECRRLHGPP
ncbi:hypothetical protein F2981_31530 (plasmid) [Sinorhizobium meliloti]|nr:hypothetical protein [Sinorhizobium meliloti]